MIKDESNGIPKIIHYCWFGGRKLPALAEKCILSWKKYCPDYEIKEWNEQNFDINQILYVQQAYTVGKYAFVSDYARFCVLEQYGGIYMDTDVELLCPLDDILSKGGYIGCEQDGGRGITLNPGLGMAAKAHDPILKEILNGYMGRRFLNEDGSLNQTTIVAYTTQIFKEQGLLDICDIQQIGNFFVYPREYFSPQHFRTGKVTITSKTHSIHYYSASWYTPYEKLANRISHILGETCTGYIVTCKKVLKKWMERN